MFGCGLVYGGQKRPAARRGPGECGLQVGGGEGEGFGRGEAAAQVRLQAGQAQEAAGGGWEGVVPLWAYSQGGGGGASQETGGASLDPGMFIRFRLPRQVSPPSRACVELPLPLGQVMQLDAILRRPPEAQGTAHQRRTLHVQSVSEWAPPCIGPYSQGVALGGLVFMAGQISLDPPSLMIVSGGLRAEARQALLNCEAVAVAMKTSVRTVSLGRGGDGEKGEGEARKDPTRRA